MITPAYALTAIERVLPSFTLDWTTGVAQGVVDVTRAGVATFVGSNGLIQSAAENTQRVDYSTGIFGLLVEESRANLLTYSEQLNDASWLLFNTTVATDAITAPDGTLTGDKVVENTVNALHLIRKAGVAVNLGATLSFSFYAQAGGRETCVVYLNDNATTANRVEATFNLSSETTSSIINAGTFTGATASIKDVGNGWYRCTLSGTATGVMSVGVRVILATGAYLGDGTSGIYLWGAQLEAGAFPTSYIPTEASAVTRNADVASVSGTNFSDFFNDAAGTFFIQSNARSGDDLLTAGSYVLAADATALKKYATTYSVDPSATQLDIGKGSHQKIMYYPQELIAAELAAITA